MDIFILLALIYINWSRLVEIFVNQFKIDDTPKK
jgi:hypothetical protein